MGFSIWLAASFAPEAYPPTGLYHNLLRLRWGAGAARDPAEMVDFTVENGGNMVVSFEKKVRNDGSTIENAGKMMVSLVKMRISSMKIWAKNHYRALGMGEDFTVDGRYPAWTMPLRMRWWTSGFSTICVLRCLDPWYIGSSRMVDWCQHVGFLLMVNGKPFFCLNRNLFSLNSDGPRVSAIPQAEVGDSAKLLTSHFRSFSWCWAALTSWRCRKGQT